MSHIEVPYLPVSEFDASTVSKKFKDDISETSTDDNLDLKSLSGKNFPEEITLALIGMGMEKYIKFFKKKQITLDTFLNLNESDLLEIGMINENDRKIIAENLKIHHKNRDELIVSENHVEDLIIIKNISYQLLLIQNYYAYIELQMRKETLIDYPIESEESASALLEIFARCALTQTQIMSCKIYDENNSDALINKLLKTYNLSLPSLLQDSMPNKKRKFFLKVMAFIGFSSVVVLTGRYLMRRS